MPVVFLDRQGPWGSQQGHFYENSSIETLPSHRAPPRPTRLIPNQAPPKSHAPGRFLVVFGCFWPMLVKIGQKSTRNRLLYRGPDISMSRGKNCLPTVSRQFLSRNYPHPSCLRKCQKRERVFCPSFQITFTVRVIARQSRDKTYLVAILSRCLFWPGAPTGHAKDPAVLKILRVVNYYA